MDWCSPAPHKAQLHACNNTINYGKKANFGTYIVLSLVFHLAFFVGMYFLTDNFRQIPHRTSVIEIDLSHIEATGRRKAPAPPALISGGKTTPAPQHPIVAKQAAQPLSPQGAPKNSSAPAGKQAPEKGVREYAEEDAVGHSPSGAEPAPLTASSIETTAAAKAGGNEGTAGTGAGHRGKKVLTNYSTIVRALIEAHKEYPRAARRMGIRGSVAVSFSLDRHGELRNVSLAKSSGCTLLDNAGLRAVRSVGRFPPPPRESMTGEEISFSLPITFTLTSG
ncbi:MAG: energy transducer TonB [Geobacteraceae bacterium]|nr:energy transducer TonB [Geobacteraceae bacterium]